MQYKAINDVIDFYDAKIVNFGVDFKLTVDSRFSPAEVMGRSIAALRSHFSEQLYIGEPIYITKIYSILGKVDGVSDVRKVEIFQKVGGSYAGTRIDLDEALSRDGTYIKTPKNVIMELKFPDSDIKGTVI